LVILVKSLDEDRNEAVIEKIRLIGTTAAFFGGFHAMEKLHDAAEALVGNDNSVGSRLNGLWDGIGGWAM
jgi:hypothetical protein